MTLKAKLWLAIIALLLMVFSGSLLVSMLSAKSYLQQQLSMKNADNAAALALSLTQQGADDILLELTVAAQFDTGFYEMIRLTDPEGRVKILRRDDRPIEDAPAWFVALFPIEVQTGIASVQSGWQQVGTLEVRSHARFAYRRLWESAQILAAIFLAAMLVSGFIGAQVLKRILKPLDDVVMQAQAIGERRFISIPEPRTLEFRQVVKAMNHLSARIRDVLAQEAERLQQWQREAHVDKVTGLNNREPFLKAVEAALESNDVNATGSLSLVRLTGLSDMNRDYGRRTVDGVLRDIGAAFNQITEQHSRWAASRLNGSDFALLAPRAIDPTDAAAEAQQAVRAVLVEHDLGLDTLLPTATTIYAFGDSVSTIMSRLDAALVANETSDDASVAIAYAGDTPARPVQEQMNYWRETLETGFRERQFSLQQFPVLGWRDELIHFEGLARLARDGETLAAGQFLPWVNRLEVSLQLDQQVVELALQAIAAQGQPVCANLSVAAVVEPGFPDWIDRCLGAQRQATAQLWLEVPEAMAFRHLERFKQLCARVKAHGVRVGIEHVGHQLSDLGKLHDIGVDYLKIDASFVRDVDTNVANQTLLRTLCTVGHSIGVQVYAEGVRSSEERAALRELGADGVAGPAITLPG
ncbi:EAL domain-containing protein [Mangrovimicrobium sediminis]|uniref:EAL domain-containing protein n=1 Tax=Mangrovimicrobium sediminis TaxID=2562682 RepID=A0A4Z0LW81_9GAMM|nr:EAL domain-containing protein [Haliea sp. SAOS-164]TGD71494.1 EAL domain-containing protein [Haliea sp. SAOS-164]